MKRNENYSVMIRRLERAGLKQVARKAGGGREAANKPTDAATNAATAMGLSTERPTFDAQRVADIKLQFAFDNYHIDTDRLAEKLLDAGVLFSNAK